MLNRIIETEYSEKELKLFAIFGYSDLVKSSFAPPLYRMIAELAFVYPEKYPSKAVESARKTCKALRECKIYRKTKEWDDLIDLD